MGECLIKRWIEQRKKDLLHDFRDVDQPEILEHAAQLQADLYHSLRRHKSVCTLCLTQGSYVATAEMEAETSAGSSLEASPGPALKMGSRRERSRCSH
jgi:hypothetical protein